MWARTDIVYVFNVLQMDKINVVGGNGSFLEANSARCNATAKDANNYSTAGSVLHLRLQQDEQVLQFLFMTFCPLPFISYPPTTATKKNLPLIYLRLWYVDGFRANC